MKKILSILLCFIILTTKGQDASFSQFDLNMMHSNPAFSGYTGTAHFITHGRYQWNKVNENFNDNILEASYIVSKGKNYTNKTNKFSLGIGLVTEDLLFTSNIGNSVFINKIDASIYGAFHKELTDHWWVSLGAGIQNKSYSLDDDMLIFSDQLSWDGSFSSISSFHNPSNFSPTNVKEWGWSIGIIGTNHGQFSRNKGDRRSAGISWDLNMMHESFTDTESPNTEIPIKITYHSEVIRNIPAYKKPFIRYVKTIAKHEQYIADKIPWPIPWQKSVISKTELGATVFINGTGLETGAVFRLDYNIKLDSMNRYHIQTFVPIMRYRFNLGTSLLVVSYSYDLNTSANMSRFRLTNSGTTHEFGLSVSLNSARNSNKKCPAFGIMTENPLYKDLYDNGMLNHKSAKRNFNIFNNILYKNK